MCNRWKYCISISFTYIVIQREWRMTDTSFSPFWKWDTLQKQFQTEKSHFFPNKLDFISILHLFAVKIQCNSKLRICYSNNWAENKKIYVIEVYFQWLWLASKFYEFAAAWNLRCLTLSCLFVSSSW